MPALPTVGGSNNTWGDELNAFLAVTQDVTTGAIATTELATIGSGTDQDHYQVAVASDLFVVRGTNAAPITNGDGPLVKASRTDSIAETAMPGGIGANNQGNAAIYGVSIGLATTEAQVNAGFFAAQSYSTQSAHNDDACAINVQAAVRGSGTGIGIGAYIEGRRDTDTGGVTGLEVRAANYTGTDGAYSATAYSGTVGILLGSGGTSTRLIGCGIQFQTTGSCQFDVGIGFPKVGGISTVKTTSIRDDSDAINSIVINGAHTIGLAIASGAGYAVIGGSARVASASLLEVIGGSTADPLIQFGSAAASAYSVNLKNSSNTSKWWISAGVNNFVTGSAAGDFGFSLFSPQKMLIGIGSGAAIIAAKNNAATAELGFFSSTTAAKQTVTGAKGSNAALGSLMTALAAYGLVIDSTSA